MKTHVYIKTCKKCSCQLYWKTRSNQNVHELIVAYLYNEILLKIKKEQPLDVCNNMNEPQKHYDT